MQGWYNTSSKKKKVWRGVIFIRCKHVLFCSSADGINSPAACVYVCVQMKSSLIQTWEVHYLLKHRAVIAEKKTFDKLLLFLIHRTCCFFILPCPAQRAPSDVFCISAPSVSLIIFLLETTNISASLCSCSAPKQTGLAHVYFLRRASLVGSTTCCMAEPI